MARPELGEPLGIKGREQPNVLVLDTGLHTVNGKPEHPDLAGCAVIHEPWLDRHDAGGVG